MATSFLTPWSNFYITTGSAAASLTGLMFVVITLVTGVERSRRTPYGISAFSTPTVAHFGAALLVSVILSAPWHSLAQVAVLIGLVGLSGIVYVLRLWYMSTRGRESSQIEYKPDLEDRIFYSILPLVAYGVVFGSALLLPSTSENALFALAGGIVLLLFIGIHNAWDIVTFIVVGGMNQTPGPPPDDKTG